MRHELTAALLALLCALAWGTVARLYTEEPDVETLHLIAFQACLERGACR